jgi:hypothetical protein
MVGTGVRTTTATPILHADKFEELLDRRGRLVQWQEAVLCSCTNMDSGQPTYTCKACHGKGFIYASPIVGKAAVTSITINQNFEAMAGIFDVGDAVMTVPKQIPVRTAKGQPTGVSTDNLLFDIGLNDKVTLLDDDFKTSEVLAKDLPVGNRAADTLLNDAVTRIKNVRTSDSVTGLITNYVLDTDYTLIDGNKINWLPSGNNPEEFQQYSIVYFHKPTYTVIATLPKPRHQDGQDFPRYVALRYLSGAVDRP